MGLRRYLARRRLDRDRAEEMRQHIVLAMDHYISQGVPPAEAKRRAILRFGNVRAHREGVDQMNRLPLLDTLGRDLRYALRMMRRAPAFNTTIIVTLALVIGATTAVFSLAHAILIKPLPYPQPDRLAVVSYKRGPAGGEYTGPSLDGGMWAAVRDHAPYIDAAVAMWGAQGVNLVLGNTPSFVQNQLVGAGYFRVLGVPPMLGREFTADEARPGGPAVAVLSFSFWQGVFHGASDALGQTILLRGEPYTVVGVMPEGFGGPLEADIWTPLQSVGQGTNYMVLARPEGNASFEAVNAQLAALGEEPFTMQRPLAEGSTRSLVVQGLQGVLVADDRQPIVMLGWAVGTVLLIACVNIAALLIARSGGRTKEVATRMALGSGRIAVVRQLMVESAMLALVGGAIGIFVAHAGLEGLKAVGGTTFAEWEGVSLDGTTIAVSFGLSALTSVFFGLLPAWQTSRIDIQAALADGGSRSIAGGSRHLARRVLVVAEVALGVVMLVAAGLLMREFLSLRSLDPGFVPDHLYSVSASLQDARYKDPAVVNQLFTRSVDRLTRTPGIQAAAVSQGLPYQRLLNNVFGIEGRPDDDQRPPIANIAYVTPEFFSTFGIAVREGRALDDRDRAGAVPVVIVNELLRDIYFPGETIVGRRLLFGKDALEIVGVSQNVQQFGAGFRVTGMRPGPIFSSPTIYLPAQQTDAGLFAWFSPVWTVRAASAGEASAALSTAIHEVDPLLPLDKVRSMASVTAESMAQPRLMMSLVGTLALAALLLSAIGIHGLVSHIVSERTREFGIRLALGASAGETVRGVAVSGLVLAAIGAAVGLALSFPATQLVSTFIANVTTRDVPTYLGVAFLLVLVAAVSSLLPALRLLRLDPAKTLRD